MCVCVCGSRFVPVARCLTDSWRALFRSVLATLILILHLCVCAFVLLLWVWVKRGCRRVVLACRSILAKFGRLYIYMCVYTCGRPVCCGATVGDQLLEISCTPFCATTRKPPTYVRLAVCMPWLRAQETRDESYTLVPVLISRITFVIQINNPMATLNVCGSIPLIYNLYIVFLFLLYYSLQMLFQYMKNCSIHLNINI